MLPCSCEGRLPGLWTQYVTEIYSLDTSKGVIHNGRQKMGELNIFVNLKAFIRKHLKYYIRILYIIQLNTRKFFVLLN